MSKLLSIEEIENQRAYIEMILEKSKLEEPNSVKKQEWYIKSTSSCYTRIEMYYSKLIISGEVDAMFSHSGVAGIEDWILLAGNLDRLVNTSIVPEERVISRKIICAQSIILKLGELVLGSEWMIHHKLMKEKERF